MVGRYVDVRLRKKSFRHRGQQRESEKVAYLICGGGKSWGKKRSGAEWCSYIPEVQIWEQKKNCCYSGYEYHYLLQSCMKSKPCKL